MTIDIGLLRSVRAPCPDVSALCRVMCRAFWQQGRYGSHAASAACFTQLERPHLLHTSPYAAAWHPAACASNLDCWSVPAGSMQGMLAAVQLRLAILGPMLPLVYADREADAARNLRSRLLHALLKLCCALDCCQVRHLAIDSSDERDV